MATKDKNTKKTMGKEPAQKTLKAAGQEGEEELTVRQRALTRNSGA
jgi:hypothetical protein